ncbi:ribose-5-phosphate isomerase RpiA [Tepidibacillus marianensis]|uniref:ribose-5-phosphate isomerase RpiA n=1 Tax=Tepidibacillus marianensis TaxID=3131995 RepID=UPI0030D2F135
MNPKQIAGEKAVEYVKDGMVLGLGTGSTVYWTIQKLGQMVKEGLQIKGIPTSIQTETIAKELNIPLLDFSEIEKIDLTIDGADEIDDNLNLIKGGGGALLREKIVASASERMIVVADESKVSKVLGSFPLPVEVTRFGWENTMRRITKLGGQPTLRMSEGQTYITDNGNYILDCKFERIKDPAQLNTDLNLIPGVVENGIFPNMADMIIVGMNNGELKVSTK